MAYVSVFVRRGADVELLRRGARYKTVVPVHSIRGGDVSATSRRWWRECQTPLFNLPVHVCNTVPEDMQGLNRRYQDSDSVIQAEVRITGQHKYGWLNIPSLY